MSARSNENRIRLAAVFSVFCNRSAQTTLTFHFYRPNPGFVTLQFQVGFNSLTTLVNKQLASLKPVGILPDYAHSKY